MGELGVLDRENEALGFADVAGEARDGAGFLGHRMKAEGGLRDHTERAECASCQFWQVITRYVLDDFAAAFCERAIR